MKVTIETSLTPAYVMANAHSGYWHRPGALNEYERQAWPGKSWPKLTESRLRRGLALAVSTLTSPDVVGALIQGGGKYADGDALDVLLQLSLFGEVLYG